MRKKAIVFGLIFFSILGAAMTAAADEAQTIGRTPPRLSFLDGQVSFWRPGAEDWTQAQINTALAPGDQLYIQGSGNLELQIGSQAYVRGGRDAQIELETQEPDFLRFKVTGGRVALDLRSLASGHTVEVDTPHGAFVMNHEGYFRLEVSDARTTFTTRRTGRASVAAAEGDAVPMEPDETVSMEGPAGNALAFQAAPPMDAWDTWNYDRTDALLEAASSRYVAPDTYGTADLDRYGSWRVLPTYGRVWVPAGVAPGWAPYSSGSWMHDPYYGWTWVDTAPWGWAPYHYGRWVHVNSYWCWAPGPVVRRAVYAPALVAFFGTPGVSVGISVGGPGVGWVALGWGEPLVPWWGRPGFIHRPWWGGWGGPHRINNRVIRHGTVVSVRDIHHYHNARIRNAFIVVDKGRFGHGRIHRKHHRKAHIKDWRPMHRAPGIRPTAASYTPTTRRGRRPSDKMLRRSTVKFGPRHAQRPAVKRHPGKVHSRSSRTAHENRSDRGHVRSRNKGLPKTIGPSLRQPSRHNRERHATGRHSNGGRRDMRTKSHEPPSINRPSTRHAKPGNRKPENHAKPPRRSGKDRAVRHTTIKNDRSRSVERPSHINRPPQKHRGRITAPAPKPPAGRPNVNARRRVPNHPAASRPQMQSNRSRPEAPRVRHSSPNDSRHRRDSSFRASPRISKPSQNRIGNSRDLQSGGADRRQFRSNRNSQGRPGHGFQGRFRN